MRRWKKEDSENKDTKRWQKPEGESATDRTLRNFAELMIEKIKTIQADWKKPWFCEGGANIPRNLSGRFYNGANTLMLMFTQEKQGYEVPVWSTADRINSLNYKLDKERQRKPVTDSEGNALPLLHVLKGEKGTGVFITTFTCVHSETKEKIHYDDYKNLTEEERAKYNVYPKLNVYNVFNVLSQTNIKEVRPDLAQKLIDEHTQKKPDENLNKSSHPAVDKLIDDQLWFCPIKQQYGDDAYYSISKDCIVIPERKQFIDGESFASNCMHEMAHSLGAEKRLNQLTPTGFGSKEYSAEELRAELTAALVSTQWGMTKHVKEDSAAYLKSWLDSLKEDPDFIKSLLNDVKKRASIMNQRIEAVNFQLEQGEKADFEIIKQYNPFDKNNATDTSENQNNSNSKTETIQEESDTKVVKSTVNKLDVREEIKQATNIDENGEATTIETESIEADKKQSECEFNQEKLSIEEKHRVNIHR